MIPAPFACAHGVALFTWSCAIAHPTCFYRVLVRRAEFAGYFGCFLYALIKTWVVRADERDRREWAK
jgi:hypothetical protein